MSDVSFNNGADFICIVPVLGSTKNTWICTEIFFGINVYHPTRNGRCAWVNRINSLTNRLSKVNEFIKNSLQVIKEILFEAGDFRGIRNFVKAAKLP